MVWETTQHVSLSSYVSWLVTANLKQHVCVSGLSNLAKYASFVFLTRHLLVFVLELQPDGMLSFWEYLALSTNATLVFANAAKSSTMMKRKKKRAKKNLPPDAKM